MSDEPWGKYGAYQEAFRAMRAALKPFAALAEREELHERLVDGYFSLNIGVMNGNHTQAVIRHKLTVTDVRNAAAAIVAAEAAGVDVTEEQGERERSDRSGHLPSTGGRTEEVESSVRSLQTVLGKLEEEGTLLLTCDDTRWLQAAIDALAGERESIATAVEGYTDILSEETARKVASRIRALK